MNDTEERRKRIPSRTIDRYWLFHLDENYVFKKEKGDRRSGKWLLFDSFDKIDEYWKLIMNALDSNSLGPSAKVATSKVKEGFESNKNRVICIYTENYNDLDDVWRIEKGIRNMGILNKLVYKLDEDVGKYEKDGFRDLIKLESKEVETIS